MDRTIAVVLPIFNEQSVIRSLAEAIETHVDAAVEFIFVDDGSTDQTVDVLTAFHPSREGSSRTIIVLSRNFGQQCAIMAGLSAVSPDADAIVVMDSDFQDDPRDISALLAALDDGCDCAYAVRTANAGSFVVNRLTGLFYRMQKAASSFEIPRHAGAFCAFTGAFREHLLAFGESDVYFPGLRAYVGMRQTGVVVERRQRSEGTSRVKLRGLVSLAMSGLLGFSAAPMRVVFVVGLGMTVLCLLLGVVAFVLKIVGITQIPGVTTVLIFLLGLSGLHIMFTGLVGEYVGRLFLESKNRPRWIVRDVVDDQ